MKIFNTSGPLQVEFHAPNETLFEVAIEVLERCGYEECQKKGLKTLKPFRFSAYPKTLKVYWVEPKPKRQDMAARLAWLEESLDPKPKYRRLL